MDTTQTNSLHLLIPIDGSELSMQAIPYAARIGGLNARQSLLRVASHPAPIRGIWGGIIATEDEVAEMAAEEAEIDFVRARACLPDGTEAETEVIAGDPADQIIQSAVRLRADMIVMASHGRGTAGRWTLGSVADRVARESLVPVMIVCPGLDDPVEPTLERIVVPYDGSVLASEALPVAADLSKRLSIPVHLVRVISMTMGLHPATTFGGPISDAVYKAAFESEQHAVEHSLTEATKQLRNQGVHVTTQILVGPTMRGIESAVTSGDLIVITSHGRSGIRRWLLGSVAERLIRDGLAPTILVPSAERATIAASKRTLELAMVPGQQ